MRRNTAIEREQEVQQVRFGPNTNRPLTPRLPPWQGAPPQGVKAILTRNALAPHLRGRYAEWASNLALLTAEFLAQTYEDEVSRIKQLPCDKWQGISFYDCCYCEVEGNYLWVQKQDQGWTVELCYPGLDPDVRILSVEKMPVLCREDIWAARLALACYPNPPANLVWHSYW